MENKSFLLSDLFEIVGPGKTSFKVHQGLLVKKSEVLARAINGSMRESETKTISIEAVDDDIDDETIMRFLEYVYTGDYPVPNPVDTRVTSELYQDADTSTIGVPEAVHKPESSSESVFMDYRSFPRESPSDHPDEMFEDSEASYRRGRSSAGKIEAAKWHEFFKRMEADEMMPTVCEAPFKNQPYEDYTLIFLCHARLYKFADRYDCPELMELSLRKLRATLSQYILRPERTAEIVALIQYTWQHTLDLEEGYDKLRLIALDTAIQYIKNLSKQESFLDLLKEPGSLSSDLVTKMATLIK